MELPGYERGSGGKFRRRPFRRSSMTPYDRPPSAARGMRGLATAGGSGSGWLSKLVDPASRFIAGSTSRLFSTLFRKRLPAPTEVQGLAQNCQVTLYVPEAVEDPSESQIQTAVDDNNPCKNFGTPGVSEIEQLLKQKIYTKAQVEYLTRLICSRTFEPSVQSESYSEKVNTEEWNAERSTSLDRKLPTSETALTIPQDVAASPAEIAKAYMSSRLPKASSSPLSLQCRMIQKDKSSSSSGPCAPKLHDLSVVPRSASLVSEVNGVSSACYPTSKSRGRSAMYRMSRSPYLKVTEYSLGSNAGPVSSQGFPRRTLNSDSKQVLKRDSSFLDGEDCYFAPTRRIRQKSGLISDSKHTLFMPSSSSRSSLHSLHKDDLKDPTSSGKPHSLNELIYASTCLQNAENWDNKVFSSNFPPVPRQSSEACRKILEQLDKFVPSREKSNLRSIAMDELPSKLTTEMLNGRALRSMVNVDTSQLTRMDVMDTSYNTNAEGLQNFCGSQTENLGKGNENCLSRVDTAEVKFETAAIGIGKQDIFNKASMPSISTAGASNPGHGTVCLQRKPAFQMTAPEDLLELDDEHDVVDVSAHSSLSVVKTDSKVAETQDSVFGKFTPENPLLPPLKSMGVSSSVCLPEISKKTYDMSQDSENGSSFRFPVAAESGALSVSPLTPIMPFPSHDRLVFQNEQTVPTFMFGSQNSGTPFPSTTAAMANESHKESKPELTRPSRPFQLEGSNQFSDGKIEACMHKSTGIVSSAGLQALGSTDAITSSTSITSSQSNGSVHSSSSPEAIPKSPVSLFSSKNNLAEASSSSTLISSASPVLSSTTLFSFGAAASTAAALLVSQSSHKSLSVDSERQAANNSLLGSSNLPTMQMGSSPFSEFGSIPPSTNSAPPEPSVLSQVSCSDSGFAVLPSSSSSAAANGSSENSSIKFGSTGGSIFGVLPAHSSSAALLFSQSLTNQPGSFSSSATLASSSSSWPSSAAFGLSSSTSTLGLGQMPFGTSNQTAKSFGSTSGFSFASSPKISSSSFSFCSSTVSSLSSPFTSFAGASNSSSFSTGCSTSNSGFSCSSSANFSSQSGSIFSQATTSGLLVSGSLSSTSSISNSMFGSSPTTGFSFGLTAPASSVSSSGFGSSSGSVFSFTSSSASMSAATASPIFGISSTSGVFSSVSPSNDQMNVEDTMVDDTNQISGPVFPTFGQLSSTPASSSFLFGSVVTSGGTPVFQFGSQQNSSIPQNTNPFQAGGNLEFAPGGSFSLGSGGGEKSARKIVKVRRDKIRRK